MGQLLEFSNNNPLLVSATVAMALAVLVYEIRLKARTLTELPSSQIVRLINQGATVVDIREAEPFAGGHIVDAVNLPAASPDSQGAARLKKNRTIVLVCENGMKSRQAVETWRKAGFENVFSLGGGLAAWRQDNLPIVAD